MNTSDETQKVVRTALAIGGLDPSGGAGILADVVTFRAMGVMAAGVVTSVTMQNSQGIEGRQDLEPGIVEGQIKSLISDIGFDVIKTGMLANAHIASIVEGLSGAQEGIPLVVDPVLRSGTGQQLSDPDLVSALINHIIPLATVITPNTDEASAICGVDVSDPMSMESASRMIVGMGAGSVLITGGWESHRRVVDVYYDGRVVEFFSDTRMDLPRIHGTGCILSSAIAAGLARGWSTESAVARARLLVRASMSEAVRVGKGDPFAYLDHLIAGSVGEGEMEEEAASGGTVEGAVIPSKRGSEDDNRVGE